MRILAIAGVVMLTALAGCAGGPPVFSGPRVQHIHGYSTSKGDRMEGGGPFIDGGTAYVEGPAHVLSYFDSRTYCSDGAWVQAFDQSTVFADKRCHARGFGDSQIYFRDGASVSIHDRAHKAHCPGPYGAPWNPAVCEPTGLPAGLPTSFGTGNDGGAN